RCPRQRGTDADGSCGFLCFSSRRGCRWWCPAGGRPAPPPLLPAPGGRTRVRGSTPEVVQRFTLRRVGEDSCPSTAGGQLMPGGRRAMYEDVRWSPGGPGCPCG